MSMADILIVSELCIGSVQRKSESMANFQGVIGNIKGRSNDQTGHVNPGSQSNINTVKHIK